MIVLFTDFGWRGPYVAQMINVLHQISPNVPVLNLFCDAPSFNPLASAHLLDAYWREFPIDTVFLCVVDPGVGTEQRQPVMVRLQGRWFVGPGNGLFDVMAARTQGAEYFDITWRPTHLSASFHGRDLFAPIAARLANGCPPDEVAKASSHSLTPSSSDDLWQIIYTDHFGNAVTGIRAMSVDNTARLNLAEQCYMKARTFGEVARGAAFYYENSNGLLEFAVNCGSFVETRRVQVGDVITLNGHTRSIPTSTHK